MQMFDPLSIDYQLVKPKTDSMAPALEPVAYLYVNGLLAAFLNMPVKTITPML